MRRQFYAYHYVARRRFIDADMMMPFRRRW